MFDIVELETQLFDFIDLRLPNLSLIRSLRTFASFWSHFFPTETSGDLRRLVLFKPVAIF